MNISECPLTLEPKQQDMVKLNKKMKQKSKAGGGNKQAMQFNHALGQHILKNPLVIQALVEKVTNVSILFSLMVIMSRRH